MSYMQLNYHVVFSTKDRRPTLDAALLPRLVQYCGGIARELGGTLLEANGPADHLHLALQIPPTLSVADFIRLVKTNSSKWVHETMPKMNGFGWQDGYAAFTVSHSSVGKVIEYIRGQHEHHKKMTFQEELLALLKKHNIPYDERYIG